MAEATRVEAEAAIHHILAVAEASAEEDFHQEEVLAEDGRQENIIIAEEAEDALTADHLQDTEDITVHRRHHHHPEEADITDDRQEEVRDVPWEQFWSLL